MRPLLVEIAMGFGIAWLYWYEIGWWGGFNIRFGILPMNAAGLGRDFNPAGSTIAALHVQYLAHVVLICLMAAASLIDIDEKTIPDAITVAGTLLGLSFATIYPWSLLPAQVQVAVPPKIDFLRLTSPNPWPFRLDGNPNLQPLALALGCYLVWCFGLLHRPWRTRHGYRRAFAILFARISRDPFSPVVLGLAVLGTVGIFAVWWKSGVYWRGLLTSLVGLAVSGGMIWAVRLIGFFALKKEAMGFGDVTLMAMAGTFMGWQPSLVIFFLAPFAALVIGGLQWLMHRESEMYYGPYLCMATLVVLLRWPDVWRQISPVFEIGWLVPTVVMACLVLMAIILAMLRAVSR